MTLEAIMQSLFRDKINVNIYIDNTYYNDGKWTVKLSKEVDGLNCNVTVKDEDFDDALRTAYKKYHRAVKTGLPELHPAIEHRPEE
jgi:hypothetical protein